MTYEEFSDRVMVTSEIRPEDGRLVLHVSIGVVYKTMRGPDASGIDESAYVERCKRDFYSRLYGGGADD